MSGVSSVDQETGAAWCIVTTGECNHMCVGIMNLAPDTGHVITPVSPHDNNVAMVLDTHIIKSLQTRLKKDNYLDLNLEFLSLDARHLYCAICD